MSAVGAEPNLNLSPEIGTDWLLPPAATPRPQVSPWAAALMSGGLTVAGVVGSAALVPNNDVGLYLAAASIWLLPSVGNIAVGNNRWAGAFWALRTMGLGMMIPGVSVLRGGSIGPVIRDEVMVIMVFGAITLAAGFVADVMGAYSFAQKIRADGLVLRF